MILPGLPAGFTSVALNVLSFISLKRRLTKYWRKIVTYHGLSFGRQWIFWQSSVIIPKSSGPASSKMFFAIKFLRNCNLITLTALLNNKNIFIKIFLYKFSLLKRESHQVQSMLPHDS